MDNKTQVESNADIQLEAQLEKIHLNENELKETSQEQLTSDADDNDSDWESTEEEEEEENTIYQLKISLKHISPKIWRCIQVSNVDTFEDLHEYIQEAMGWRNYHLHQFQLTDGTLVVTQEEADCDDDFDSVSENEMELKDYFTKVGDKALYIYDMDDDWVHEIVLEQILEKEENVYYPRCVGGKRACPPEDSGGPFGYQRLLKIMADPSHEDHEVVTIWLEDMYPGFHPEKFDRENVFTELYLELEKFK